jgi:hypothetical protein
MRMGEEGERRKKRKESYRNDPVLEFLAKLTN